MGRYMHELEDIVKLDHKVERSLVDPDRLLNLAQFMRTTINLAGDVAEIGVYRGGTAKLIAQMMPTKIVHLFDTFEGMPEVDSKIDLHKKGDFSDTSLEAVKEYLSGINNVQYYKGLFPETSKPVENKKFCFVHIDVDIYTSVIDCCNFFYPRMTPAGIMIFDDYGFFTCPGAKKAVEDFFSYNSGKNERHIFLPSGQCFVIKQ
jgi:O-methyltransferase